MIRLPKIKTADLSTYGNFAKCHQARVPCVGLGMRLRFIWASTGIWTIHKQLVYTRCPTMPGSSCTGLSPPSVPGGEGLVARLSPHVLDSLHLPCRVERG